MSADVLVLNANFEPIHICDLRRAISLMMAEKATMVLNGRGEIRTVRQVFPRPSVIRLMNMIHRPRPKIKLTRREIFRRDAYTCQYCGRRAVNLTIDHVIPRHMGGRQCWDNVVVACAACNHRKGGRTLEEAGMRLLRPPREPQASIQYIFSHHLQEFSEWQPFIDGW